ncbi:hypothetical protein HKX42_03245 [Salinisphaera sp. USBA-960]|uniref:hypothetical protein n=1 Tax=Salinisphaera orenii TaxID=856731 RepID=UPI000DBE69AE|nr:hypothetical protein [Salifodinibacter halophilus]NNC25894.1 hypothetical protein [Salifodinibacter halophilus]
MHESSADNQTPEGDEPVDIGGLSIKRSVITEVLPEPERFERHRAEALAVDEAMSKNNGDIPAYVNEWPQERIEAVVATLKELGSLRSEAQRQLKESNDNAGDDSQHSEERPVSQLFRHGNG